MMEDPVIVSFRVPRISLGGLSNVVGLAGLVAIAVAIGALTGNWWWSCLTGGVFAVGLAVMAGLSAEATEQQAEGLRPVARAS